MWLRYKRWQQLALHTVHKAVLSNTREYVFTKEQFGLCFVPFREDIDRLLNPRNDLPSEIELAYETYGVQFDAHGRVVVETTTSEAAEALTPPKRTRPKKIEA